MSSKHSDNNIDCSHRAATESRAVGDGDPQRTLQTEDGNMMKLRPVESTSSALTRRLETNSMWAVFLLLREAGCLIIIWLWIICEWNVRFFGGFFVEHKVWGEFFFFSLNASCQCARTHLEKMFFSSSALPSQTMSSLVFVPCSKLWWKDRFCFIWLTLCVWMVRGTWAGTAGGREGWCVYSDSSSKHWGPGTHTHTHTLPRPEREKDANRCPNVLC